MYLRYSIGFFVASLVQGGIVFLTETLNFSSLNPKFSVTHMILHFLVGQVAGYILLYLMRNVAVISKTNTWTVGIIYGVLFWAVMAPIGSSAGFHATPWAQGIATLSSTIIAHVAYAIVATFTIKLYGKTEIR